MLYLFSVSDLQINSLWTEETRLNQSREVMTTMGEWQLVGIKVKRFDFSTYQELRFFVRMFLRH